ncbi:fumarylacetoacetate hydrolase family protein [Breznakia pachnodae]|uniref:2-keto-4-pentenoate hydratase/2-oxohepta-3-ene-1,7-dioic acid hydratase in catechol pathway n=1 Tax=Breznakia pachnodae TaxID=265178 RepID=A0ABU0E0Y1_9FIRM|nr:fumarylacetoacetate hydrolase family protein [Breznakia pachnodae]MDQ0360543.1 2-keto-4-pentenoate hydratase/2-oxohepta-3-ene-1,7-dioic acid hydratase in catechol pathway [Breznakia pachnodae]
MKFGSYKYQNKDYIGVLSKDEQSMIDVSKILHCDYDANMNTFIQQTTDAELQVIKNKIETSNIAGHPIDSISLYSPIRKPIHDILCVGVNYEDHKKEAVSSLNDNTLQKPKRPVLFTKRANSIIGPNASLHACFDLDNEVDYEAELAIILRKNGKNIDSKNAIDCIFGYSVFNDFSSRTLQREHTQWLKGKSLDEYSSMGPFIVTVDEFNINNNYKIQSTVNDELRQNSSLDYMIYKIPELISVISAGMTLEAADIIATGTPAGVGMGFQPPRYLKENDFVSCTIEGIGTLTNKIVK